MRVITLPLMKHPPGMPSIAYPEPQTILELRRKRPPDLCGPRAPWLNDSVQTYFITPDLSGPDPRIVAGDASAAAHAQLVEYQGEILLMNADAFAVWFLSDRGYGYLQRFCEIQSR